jgi:hypothetical protein
MPSLRSFTGLISFMLCNFLFANDVDVYVDKGACPGEGCEYCALYVAKTDVPVYEEASIGSNKLGVITVADTFIARTGEVHTVPTRFEVHREHDGIGPEDEVFALTYVGEGYFRIFLNGELQTADLGFSPWGGSGGKTCDNPAYCWGRLVRELEFTWWMWVVAESGLTGWVIADDSIAQIDGRSH